LWNSPDRRSATRCTRPARTPSSGSPCVSRSEARPS
jgi:hypothetical protein